jgi:hypothetical protein
MGFGGVVIANKICPELGPRLAAMTWDQIKAMIKQFIAEDDCQRAPGSDKRIIERAKQRDYKADPIGFLSKLAHDLESEEIYCQERGVDLRKKTKANISFYRGRYTPAVVLD